VITTDQTKATVYWTVDSPIGELLLSGDGEQLQRLHMQDSGQRAQPGAGWRRESAPFAELCDQLDEYFGGDRRQFDLGLDPRGSEFELRVWKALRQIPYGETEAYGELAERIGHPGHARAVGAANARNPIAVVIPCHRVIGADGSLTGYAGGLERKRLLLDLEAPLAQLDLSQARVSSSRAKTKLS
jgi:methylated-DNA-[protein]-cysteine S-methyltransferase